MNQFNLRLALPLIAIVSLLLAVAWIAGIFSEKMAPGISPPQQLPVSEAVAVVESVETIYEPVPATIKAKQATIISSRILARIEQIHVRAGDMVNKGQLLLELDQVDLQSRVSQTEARVQSINAHMIEARQSLARTKQLKKSGVMSTADLERAQSNYDALLADLANARQSTLEAKTALGFASIHAPIDGRIVDRFAEPGDTAQPGVPLLSLYNPTTLRVEANVREQLALSLELGQQLQVFVPATNSHLESVVEELVPAGNPGSRSFLIKNRLQQSEGLLPGLYARLQIPTGTKSLLLIPADRVAQVGQLDVVWLDRTGIAERRFIRTGKTTDDGLLEVISGLQPGDRILAVP